MGKYNQYYGMSLASTLNSKMLSQSTRSYGCDTQYIVIARPFTDHYAGKGSGTSQSSSCHGGNSLAPPHNIIQGSVW